MQTVVMPVGDQASAGMALFASIKGCKIVDTYAHQLMVRISDKR